VCLEVVRVGQCLANDSVVVDFTVDSKGNAVVFVGKWLRSTVDTDDTQTLMSKDCEVLVIALRSSCSLLTGTVGHIASRPIWTTMATLLHHLQGFRLESLCVGHMVASNDSAHIDVLVLCWFCCED
jgi:hypothetical protein